LKLPMLEVSRSACP